MELPVLRHLILCEKVIPPTEGRNCSIENIVYTLVVRAGTAKPAFPRLHPKLFLLVAMTGRETHRFSIDLVYWKEGVDTMVSAKTLPAEIDLGKDPLLVHLMPIPMENIVFDAPGDYDFVFRCDGAELGRVPIHLRENR